MKEIEVFVFSYNRGKYLRNCIDSIRRHVPSSRVTVVDDASTDPETCKVLEDISGHTTVVKRSKMLGIYGGYWNNMQYTIDELSQSDWAVFIEDDMQFIRPVLQEDLERIELFFDKFPKSGYLALEFMKEELRDRDYETVSIDESVPVYFFRDEAEAYRGTIYCSNIGAVNIKYMRSIKYRLGEDEKQTREKAKIAFDKMGFYPYPLLMFLPFSEAVKNSKRTLVRRLVEKWYKAGFYPYRDLSEAKLVELLERDLSVLPITGDYLTTKNTPPQHSYVYKDSMKRCNGVIRRLEKLERLIRHLE